MNSYILITTPIFLLAFASRLGTLWGHLAWRPISVSTTFTPSAEVPAVIYDDTVTGHGHHGGHHSGPYIEGPLRDHDVCEPHAGPGFSALPPGETRSLRMA